MPQTENKREQLPFTAIILAGGQANRMAGINKGLIEINGKSCIQYIINVLTPQTSSILINANKNRSDYQHYGYPVIKDNQQGYLGPLAGIETALTHATHPLILTLPCDAPLIRPELITRLLEAMTNNKCDVCIAHDGKHLQPVFTLLRKSQLTSLHEFIKNGGRKTRTWLLSLNHCLVDYSDHPEQFFNMNSPADKTRLEDLIK
ncbi:MAG: molybdenum cofactor guanylyltransferase [Gammaproteobacteria bacterium]|nr:molybdenum cofactor guanylyltransferase [Gammaproteobacteria bacterium]